MVTCIIHIFENALLLILFVAAFSASRGLNAQNKEWSDLRAKIDMNDADSVNIERILDLAFESIYSLPDSVTIFTDLAMELSEIIGYNKGVVSALSMKATSARKRGQFEQAEAFLHRAIGQVPEINELRIWQLKDNLATILSQTGRTDSCIILRTKALEVFKKYEDTISIEITTLNLSYLYLDVKNYEAAKSIMLKNRADFKSVSSKAYNDGNLAIAYKNLGMPDSALYYYKSSMSLIPNDLKFIAGSEGNIGLLFLEAEKFDSSLVHLKRSQEIYSELLPGQPDALLMTNLALAFLRTNDLSKAKKYALEARDRIESKKDYYYLRRNASVLSEIYEQERNYELAHKFYKEMDRYQDSLVSQESKSSIKEMQIKYETAEKERKLSELNLLASQQQIKMGRNRNLLIVFMLMVFSLAVILYSSVKNGKIKDQLQVNALEIEKQKSKELLHQNHILGMTAMIEGQEEERKRIAKDLHDGLGGLMATIKSYFTNIQHDLDRVRELNVYEKTGKLINEACEEVRRISHDMMPTSLSLMGLTAALEDLGSRINLTDMQCQVEIVGEDRPLPDKKEIMIFRLVQELVHNVVKHANAQNLFVQLNYSASHLSLLVEDDGIGFDTGGIKNDGIGLKSVRSRVYYLNGDLDIYSRPNEGTSIQIQIPI